MVHAPNTSYASTVPAPDLEIRAGEGGWVEGGGLPKKFIRPFRPQFGLKIRGEAGPPDPSPRSTSVQILIFIYTAQFTYTTCKIKV